MERDCDGGGVLFFSRRHMFMPFFGTPDARQSRWPFVRESGECDRAIAQVRNGRHLLPAKLRQVPSRKKEEGLKCYKMTLNLRVKVEELL